jgi:hypothetical protein
MECAAAASRDELAGASADRPRIGASLRQNKALSDAGLMRENLCHLTSVWLTKCFDLSAILLSSNS